MARSKQQRKAKLSLAKKLGKEMHCSSKKVLEILPSMNSLFNEDFVAKISARLNLNEEEIYIMIGEKAKEVYEKAKEIKKKEKQSFLFNYK